MRIKIIPTVIISKAIALILVLCSVTLPAQSEYTAANNELFISPYFSSINSADIVFRADPSITSNPAAMAGVSGNSISTGYTGYFKNTFSVTTAGFIMDPGGRAGFGVYAGYLFVPDIMDTRGLEENEEGYPVYDPDRVSIETSSEMVCNIALGFNLVDAERILLSTGLSLHMHRKRLIDWTGAGLNAGMILNFRDKGIYLALNAENITTQGIYWSENHTSYSLPELDLGLGISREIDYIYGRLSLFFRSPDVIGASGLNMKDEKEEAGSSSFEDESADPVEDDRGAGDFFAKSSYGIEYAPGGVAEFRFGFIPSGRISFGGGLNLFDKMFSVDFTYFTVRNLPGTYAASLGYSF